MSSAWTNPPAVIMAAVRTDAAPPSLVIVSWKYNGHLPKAVAREHLEAALDFNSAKAYQSGQHKPQTRHRKITRFIIAPPPSPTNHSILP